MLRVTVLGDVWDALRDRFQDSEPLEDGAFVLGRPIETASGVRLVIDREVSLPSTGERWNIQEVDQLRPTTEYKSIAMGEASQTDQVPIFIHTHPDGPTRFSPTDELMHEAWLRDFVESATQGTFGSLVVHDHSVVGALWTGADYKTDRHPIDVVNCCGTRPIRTVRQLDDAALDGRREPSPTADPATVQAVDSKSATESIDVPDWFDVADRQIRLIDRIGQELLESASVAIVGLGGTGSAAAVQCARAGIGSLLLIDPDEAEVSNANRLYGLTLAQARAGDAKTNVVQTHLEHTTLADIETVQVDVTSGNHDAAILDCDLIIGCTELVEQEVEDGYLRDDTPEPSTILMTTMAATMGVTQAMAYLLNQENIWDEKVIFNVWSCGLQWEPTDRRDDCLCQSDRWTAENNDISTFLG